MANSMETGGGKGKVDPVEVQDMIGRLKEMYPDRTLDGEKITDKDFGIAASLALSEFGPEAKIEDIQGLLKERLEVRDTPSVEGMVGRLDGTIASGDEARKGNINEEFEQRLENR